MTDKEKEIWSFNVVKTKQGRAGIEIFGRCYLPEDLNSLMIKFLMEYVEEKLGRKPAGLVGTVPAYWNSLKRRLARESSV